MMLSVAVSEKPTVPAITSIHKHSGSSSRHMVKSHFSVSFEISLGYKLITGNGSCFPVARINSQQFM